MNLKTSKGIELLCEKVFADDRMEKYSYQEIERLTAIDMEYQKSRRIKEEDLRFIKSIEIK